MYIEDSVALKTIIKYGEDGNQGNTWVVYQTNYSVESTRGLSKDGMKQLINDSWAEALGDGTLLSEMRKVEPEVIGVSTGMEVEEAEAADEEGGLSSSPSSKNNDDQGPSDQHNSESSNEEQELSDEERLRRWQIRIGLAQFCSMVITIFTVMIGRLVVLWSIAPHYTPIMAGDDLIYANLEAYLADGPTDAELYDLGCHSLMSRLDLSEVPPGWDPFFSFLVIELHPDMAFSGYAAFSVILGLIIYLALQGTVAWLEIKLERRINELKKRGSRNHGVLGNKFCRLLFTAIVGILASYLVFVLIESQQSVVLMPLTQVTPTPYCLVVDSPSGLPAAMLVRFFIYSICAIPIGVPAALLGACMSGALCAGGSDTGNRRNDDDSGFILALIGAAGCILLFSGLGLIGIWLFVGCGVGVWVNFDSKFISVTQTTTLLAEMFAPALFFIKEMLSEVASWC